MGSLFKLQAKSALKNPTTYMSLVMATIFMIVFGAVFSVGSEGSSVGTGIALGVVISMIMLNNANNAFGYSLFTLKDSIMLKRIGSTKITKFGAVVSFILWGITQLLFTILYLLILTWFLGAVGFFPALIWNPSNEYGINYIGLFTAIIIGGISFYLISFFFASISTSAESYRVISQFYFFFAVLLGGGFSMTGGSEWQSIVSKLTPVGWNRDFLIGTTSGADVFNFNDGYYQNGSNPLLSNASGTMAALNIFMPMLFSVGIGAIAVKTFEWDS